MATQSHDITPPLEFAGEGQLILFTRYGDPRLPGWGNKWLNEWHVQNEFGWFPHDIIRIHKHFRPMLQAAFTKLENVGLHKEIKTFDGCYELREARDAQSLLSLHSWGAAIDLNAMDNPVGSLGTWTDAFLSIMEECDVICGQRWTGRTDPKHFSMVNG